MMELTVGADSPVVMRAYVQECVGESSMIAA